MSAPQLTDPGTSSEWFPAVDASGRDGAAARRQRFRRLVAYTMVGLTGFAVLGLGSHAWRRHTLQAALAAPPPVAAPLAAPAAIPAPAATPPPAPEMVPPPPAASAQPAPAPARVAAKVKPAARKKPASFLESLKRQPAKIQRR